MRIWLLRKLVMWMVMCILLFRVILFIFNVGNFRESTMVLEVNEVVFINILGILNILFWLIVFLIFFKWIFLIVFCKLFLFVCFLFFCMWIMYELCMFNWRVNVNTFFCDTRLMYVLVRVVLFLVLMMRLLCKKWYISLLWIDL